jgi:hypothetical protein
MYIPLVLTDKGNGPTYLECPDLSSLSSRERETKNNNIRQLKTKGAPI